MDGSGRTTLTPLPLRWSPLRLYPITSQMSPIACIPSTPPSSATSSHAIEAASFAVHCLVLLQIQPKRLTTPTSLARPKPSLAVTSSPILRNASWGAYTFETLISSQIHLVEHLLIAWTHLPWGFKNRWNARTSLTSST